MHRTICLFFIYPKAINVYKLVDKAKLYSKLRPIHGLGELCLSGVLLLSFTNPWICKSASVPRFGFRFDTGLLSKDCHGCEETALLVAGRERRMRVSVPESESWFAPAALNQEVL